jgi:Domain of unknown function (DUF4387)
MLIKLTDIAGVIRSKNAGPYELTLDVIFTDREWYQKVVTANAIDRRLISRLYHIAEADILELVAFDPAAAIKITMRRTVVAGDVGDTDVYGAQQHAPLLDVVLDIGP